MPKKVVTISISDIVLKEIEKLNKTVYRKAPKSAVFEELLEVGLQHIHEHLREKEISVAK